MLSPAVLAQRRFWEKNNPPSSDRAWWFPCFHPGWLLPEWDTPVPQSLCHELTTAPEAQRLPESSRREAQNKSEWI